MNDVIRNEVNNANIRHYSRPERQRSARPRQAAATWRAERTKDSRNIFYASQQEVRRAPGLARGLRAAECGE